MARTGTVMDTFARDIRLATQDIEPAKINAALAAFAKSELQKAIQSGEASSTFDRYVNARKGAPEESVNAPGPILYVFSYWPNIIRAALEELRRHVPVKSGRYASGFIVLADGAVVRRYADIGPESEVIILNVRPYTRKMEVGANGARGRSSGKHHFERAKVTINRQFRETLRCETRFLDVRSGIHPGVPWILRRSGGRRRDRSAGQPITYPSLVMNMVR